MGVNLIATTRIISMHINRSRTVAQCLTDRTDYAKNPEKTQGGELVSSFACDPATVDAEFLFAKRQYRAATGRDQKNDVIAYQVRQSFKPGEVTPEEANRIGYEFAERFLKGKHAFIVATHTDRRHVHNHIIWNSTTLDCKGKFRDFLRSAMAVRRLSDLVCLEHRLSVIEKPQRGGLTYDKWLGDKAKPSQREQLRQAIDAALERRPADLDALLALLAGAGIEVQHRGKSISLRTGTGKKFLRLDRLGEGYGETELRAVLAGEKEHKPGRKRDTRQPAQRVSLLVDIEAKLRAGKGTGYARWASKFNLKQTAQTLAYLNQHQLLDYQVLSEKTAAATDRYHQLGDKIKAAEKRMAEIAVLRTHIVNYAKTREVYVAYRRAGYSKQFRAEHEADILLHQAAKRAFDELAVKKLPKMKDLQAEYAALLAEKKAAYADYRKARDEMRELLAVKANVDQIMGHDGREAAQEKEHGQR